MVASLQAKHQANGHKRGVQPMGRRAWTVQFTTCVCICPSPHPAGAHAGRRNVQRFRLRAHGRAGPLQGVEAARDGPAQEADGRRSLRSRAQLLRLSFPAQLPGQEQGAPHGGEGTGEGSRSRGRIAPEVSKQLSAHRRARDSSSRYPFTLPIPSPYLPALPRRWQSRSTAAGQSTFTACWACRPSCTPPTTASSPSAGSAVSTRPSRALPRACSRSNRRGPCRTAGRWCWTRGSEAF